MMNVQSINCQPIKPTYGSVSSKPAFRGDEYINDPKLMAEIKALRELRDVYEMEKTDNKKAGFSGIFKGAVMASLAWFTLIAAAPKSLELLTKGVKKIYNLSIIKKPLTFAKNKSIMLGRKIKNIYQGINPESKTGKVKAFIEKPVKYLKAKLYNPAAKYALEYIEKHNINAPKLKNMLIRTLAGVAAGSAFIESTGLTKPVNSVSDGASSEDYPGCDEGGCND